MMNGTRKRSRLFYLGVAILLITGSASFFALVNAFSGNEKTVIIPGALPVMAIIVFYEGVVKKGDLSDVGVKKDDLWRNIVRRLAEIAGRVFRHTFFPEPKRLS